MLENQLNFNRQEESNYFIYNSPQNQMLYQPNNLKDLQNTKLIQGAINEAKQQTLPYSEQLEFQKQKNENIFPIEKANPLYFNQSVNKESYQRKIANIIKNNKRNKKIGIANNKKKHFSQLNNNKKKNYAVNQIKSTRTFDLNTYINTKGLFDPYLKKNELGDQTRTRKQLNDKIGKIQKYDARCGKKVQNLQKYKNYLDVYEDLENKKNELDYRKSMIYEKLQSSNTNDLRQLLDTIPKPNIKYTQCNLDFNFSKYDEMIKALEEQINNERKLREEDNHKYWQMIKEHKGIDSGNNNPQRARSTNKTFNNTNKQSSINRNRNKIKRAKSGNLRYLNKHMAEEERFRNQNRQFAKSVEKIIDRDVNSLCRDLSIKESRIKRNTYFPNSNKRWRKGKRTKNRYSYASPPRRHITTIPRPNDSQKQNTNQMNTSSNIRNYNANNINQQKPPQVQNPDNNNSKQANIISSIENQIRNEVLQAEQRFSNEKINKFELLNKVNNSIDNYSKCFPIILDQVNNAIEKIKEVNVNDDKTHPLIKMASKSAGHMIANHIDEIINMMLTDLLIELIFDLEIIENIKLKKVDKANFVHFISNYYGNIQQMRSIEDYALQKVSDNKNVVTSNKTAFNINSNNNINSNQINNYSCNTVNDNNICNQIDIVNRKLPRGYMTNIPEAKIKNCEKYKKEYNEYIKLKGSLYYPNIYEIYDQVVNEETSRVLNEELDYCLKQVDDFVNELYKEEVLNQVDH